MATTFQKMDTKCRLCSERILDKSIDMFDEAATAANILAIIVQHFGIEVNYSHSI